MKIFGKYFAHRAKKSLGRFAVIAVLSLIYLMPLLMEEVNTSYNDPDWFYVYGRFGDELASKFNSTTFLVCVLCVIIPILEFAGFHNRKNADTMLSMPISRVKLALVHFLNGAWQIVALLTCYLSIYIGVLINDTKECLEVTSYGYTYDIKLFIPYYFTVILTCLLTYSFFVLIFNFASNVADGVVFVICYNFAGLLLWTGINILFDVVLFGLTEEYMLPYNLTVDVSSKFFDALMNDGKLLKYAFGDGWIINDMIIPMIIAAVGTAVFVACLIWLFACKKAEKIEGISNFPLGYAFLIPLYGISFSVIQFGGVHIPEITTNGALILIAMIVGYMIYRRSFKLKIPDIIMIALTVVVMFAANPISQMFDQGSLRYGAVELARHLKF